MSLRSIMVLYLRKVVHQQARESYRVVLKDDASETEVGSIGPQHEAGAVTRWVWAIDTVVPMREHEQWLWHGPKRLPASVQCRWGSDPARLIDFLRMKRRGPK